MIGNDPQTTAAVVPVVVEGRIEVQRAVEQPRREADFAAAHALVDAGGVARIASGQRRPKPSGSKIN